MEPDQILLLAILAAAIVLFVSEKLRVDVVALMTLVALVLTGLVTPEEGFSGFSSPAVITVWSVFIISGALVRVGVADALARYMLRVAGRSYTRVLLVIMVTVGLMSAFMNNIGAVAILLPAVISIAHELEIPPSKLLIPLAFTSLLGGKMTLIGTPPNLLAANIMETYGGMPGFGFFDYTPMGVVVLTTGIVYMLVIGRHLLPARTPGGDLTHVYQIHDYLAEICVCEDSPLIGRTLEQARFGERFDLDVLYIRRDHAILSAVPDRMLRVDDVLFVEGSPEKIVAVGSTQGLRLWPENACDDAPSGNGFGRVMIEIALSPNSRLQGYTLRGINFRNRYGMNVLAIRHQGQPLLTELEDVPLNLGDALLVEGAPDKLLRLRSDPNFLVLDRPPRDEEARRTSHAPIAVAILVGVLVLITFKWLDTSTAMLSGALLMVLSGALNMDEAYQAIHWKSVFLIAGMLPMGVAMEKTGTAVFLADRMIEAVGDMGATAVLFGIFLLTALFTEVMSNAVATVLVVPIAIDAARGLGADPRAFVMMVVVAAATSFLMPIGHQANVIIFGPGGYKFLDYPRVGFGLTLAIAVITMIVLPVVWPLYP
jgi:di/tricarboxylate transporter